MARFNRIKFKPITLTANRAGGEAYEQSPEMQLISLLLTSFLKDKFYEGAAEQLARIRQLATDIKDKKFLAQAAIYARDKFGMRSVTHVLAAEVAHQVKGPKEAGFHYTPKRFKIYEPVEQSWIPSFIDKVVVRVDDATEILAYYLENCAPKVPNNLKKGLARALGKFDAYALGKYRGESKGIKLVDLVNLVHPVPTPRNAEALRSLVKGKLKSTDTWESAMSNVGHAAKEVAGDGATEQDLEAAKAVLKKGVWLDQFENKKIKYFACLRNLRNVMGQAPEVLPLALKMLVDAREIHKSRVLPFRFMTAIKQFEDHADRNAKKVIAALSDAMEISLDNTPTFDGETVVVLDVSGSMQGGGGFRDRNDGPSPAEIGGLFAAMLIKKNNCDLVQFAERAAYVNVNVRDSADSIVKKISNSCVGGSTNMNAVFPCLRRKYDRIIILSDFQNWNTGYTPKTELNAYKKLYKADPFVYSWDLAGHGDIQFPERQVFCLAGFSDKAFDTMKFLEQDKNALINEIKAVKI